MAFTKFNCFALDLASGVHQLQTGTSHVLKVALTNTAPIATNSVLANITQISAVNGYTADGLSVGTLTGSQTGGVFTLIGGTDPLWTAAGGAIGPLRYAVLYNSTPTSPLKPLIGWWDYGVSLTVTDGNRFAVDLDQILGMFTVQ